MTSPAPGLLVLAGVLGVALFGLAEVVLASARRADLRQRATGAPPRARSTALVESLVRAFDRTRFGRGLTVRLQAAGLTANAATFVLLALAAGVAGGWLVSLTFGRVLAVLAAVLIARGFWWWLEYKVEQRKTRFVAQLPDLARLLSNGASAGLSIVGALEIAARELDDPAASELRVALEEIRIGQSFDRAFENLGERMPSRELGVLVSTLVIQQRSGGDLVSALADMSNTLEARKDTLREVRTIMSGAVASAYIVAAMGIGSVFLFDLMRPGALDALTENAVGVLILVVAAALYAAGILLIRRITRVET